MAKKRRHYKRSIPWLGKAINLGFKALGVTVAAGPAIYAVSQHTSDPINIPASALYEYSGFDIHNPGLPETGHLMVGVASVIGGIGLAKLGGILGRYFR